MIVQPVVEPMEHYTALALLLPPCWRLVPRLAAVAGNSALVNISSRMSAVCPSPALVVLIELGPMGFFSF